MHQLKLMSDSLDTLLPGVLGDDSIFGEGLSDWVFLLLLFLFSLFGLLSSLLGGGGRCLGLFCACAGLLALLLYLGQNLVLRDQSCVIGEIQMVYLASLQLS